jgi:hypothetical protein
LHASLLEDSGSNAWIDDEVDGASIPAGTPISVISQAFARGSVSGVLPSVDGTPIEFDLVGPADRQHSFLASTGQDSLPAGAYLSVDVSSDLALPNPVEVIVDPNDLFLEKEENNNVTSCTWMEEPAIDEIGDPEGGEGPERVDLEGLDVNVLVVGEQVGIGE